MRTFTLIAALAATISSVSAQVAIAQAGVDVNVDVHASAVAIVGAAAPPAITPVPVPVVPVVPGVIIPGCTITSYRPGIVTITALYTSTYCQVCDNAKISNLPYVTTYTTVLLNVCPTGYTSATYTVTATVTGTTPVPVIPSGYTTSALVCTACPGQPTVTVTLPAGSAKPTTPVLFTGGAPSTSSNGLGSILAVAGTFIFLGMALL